MSYESTPSSFDEIADETDGATPTGRFTPLDDESSPEENALTDDDAVSADSAVSTGDTHADEIDLSELDITQSGGPDPEAADTGAGGVSPF